MKLWSLRFTNKKGEPVDEGTVLTKEEEKDIYEVSFVRTLESTKIECKGLFSKKKYEKEVKWISEYEIDGIHVRLKDDKYDLTLLSFNFNFIKTCIDGERSTYRFILDE